jgi:hypothetical protein
MVALRGLLLSMAGIGLIFIIALFFVGIITIIYCLGKRKIIIEIVNRDEKEPESFMGYSGIKYHES